MQSYYKNLKIALLLIVIVVFLAYAFIAYMPHGHECFDSDCLICNMVDCENDLLLNASMLSFIQSLPLFLFILHLVHERIVSSDENTPVALKVKLSN